MRETEGTIKLTILVKRIRDEYKWWNEIAEHGCSDPYWPDGSNLNLIRNRILSLRREAIDRAREDGASIPPEAYWSLPPEVPPSFMAKGNPYRRRKEWADEKVSEIVLRADMEMSCF